MSLHRIQIERGIKLPDEYLDFITDIDIDQEYFLPSGQDGNSEKGTGWFFLTVTRYKRLFTC